MFWMMWTLEKEDRYGLEHYRQKNGVAPNRVQVPLDFPEQEAGKLAQALGIPVEQIIRTATCAKGIIFLSHETTPKEKKTEE